MSVEVISWALNKAPVDEASAAFVLVGLANHTGPDGRGAFPSVARLVSYTRLGERTVREQLDILEAAGIIKPCAPAVVAAYVKRADRRPKGWDIDITLDRGNPQHLARFQNALAAVKTERKARRDRLAAKRNTPRETSGELEVRTFDSPQDGVQPSPQTGCDDRLTGVRPSQDRGATVAPEPSCEPPHEPSEISLPAVGEGPHRKADPLSDLRPGNEDQSVVSEEPGDEADPRDDAPRSGLGAVWMAMPEVIRHRVTGSAQAKVLDAIKAELAPAGTRTHDQLADRVRRRWAWWQTTGDQVGNPVKFAVWLVERRCVDVGCEDGVMLHTDRQCLACADRRPLKTAPVGETRTTQPALIVPSSSRPDSRTVAEALAPVPYVPDLGEMPPARPSRSTPGPNAAVAELRARWAAQGRYGPAQRRVIAAAS